ncbi:MAG: hypothetical protein H9535_19335 [Ignavibacteria bacterium]|nr:hypothetical protein [Ignavibacteria bacterium]
MLSQEQQDGFKAFLNQPAGKQLIKHLRQKAHVRIDRDNPNPNAALYQSAQMALVRHIENLAGGNADE